MQHQSLALIVAVRAHGEHGAIVRATTADRGLLAGYVRGGRSRRLRPVLLVGNRIVGSWRARTDDQLAALTVELESSRSALMHAPLSAVALEWVTALAATVLPEGQPYPRVHGALDAMLLALENATSAREWAWVLADYEAVVLDALGYGLVAREAPLHARLSQSGERLARELLEGRTDAILEARRRVLARLEAAGIF